MDSSYSKARSGDRLVRHITLEKASNLRDMGGYATRCGRTVRWGTLYRGGELVKVTDRDIDRLADLGLSLIFDLRSIPEREARPSRLWDAGPRRAHRDYVHSGADLPTRASAERITVEALRRSMFDLYGRLPWDHADAFRDLLSAIAADELPLLFHCAGGKDRTGVFAALLLDLLGVARADVNADYLLSNDGIDAARARFLNHVDRPDIDIAVWDPILLVEPAYLDAMFAAVETRHGDTAGYAQWLGLSPDTITSIRNRVLEPA